MQLTASFRREFTGVSRYRLSELPKGCAALNAVLGVVAHQYLFDLLALLFQKTAAACQAFQFVFEVNINLRSPLYLNRLLHEVILAEQTLCEVFDSRDGCLRVEFIGLVG